MKGETERDLDYVEAKERRRLRMTLRGALFNFFLWSLPVATPPPTVGLLAEEVCNFAEERLARFKESNLA